MKLTKRAVEAIAPGNKVAFFWDDDLHGFGVRVSPGGTRAFIVQYRDEERKTLRKTLGTHPALSVDRAREAAGNELASRRLGMELTLRFEGGPTFGTVLDEFLAATKAKRALRTAADYEARIEKYIRPKFGKKPVRKITRLEIEQFLHGFSDRPAQGNHVITILVAALSYAVKPMRALKPHEHPGLGIEKYPENKRDRHLSVEEIGRFGKALAELQAEGTVSPWAAGALRLLMLTGARSGEILGLKWAWVDFEKALLDLPTSKTGAKRIKLSTQAMSVLKTIPRVDGCDYVIAGRRHGEAMTSLQRPFGEVVKKAGIAAFRIHDLRHTFASLATSEGVGLPIVGKVLGQSQAYTTQRYSHIHDEAERKAVAAIGSRIGRHLKLVAK